MPLRHDRGGRAQLGGHDALEVDEARRSDGVQYLIYHVLYYTVSRDSAGILDLKIYACACALILKSHAEADSFLSRER